ncbi:CLAVATA3/ESR (CLE)-related protein 10-like [Carica papaya]|uniref:CLAVATA3/ESR (CLE)-related protein 10-like n=1 Tax=Carica papaya TaxID=3649 RepID=UPI000B8CEBCF|nr:CLAVATA3/ESR (CLE)-related protein 10-like [Carica papaya]
MAAHRLFILIPLILLLIFSYSTATTPTKPYPRTSSRTHHQYRYSCDSFPRGGRSRSLCIQLQRAHQHRLLRRPPPSSASSSIDESVNIDPRYAMENRVVPSGPNPLHN